MSGKGQAFESTERWRRDAASPSGDITLRLRLAAMAGHMASDRTAARRGALIDILADGRPHEREELIRLLQDEFGEDCWGARPHEALLRDVDTLRRGGVRVAYSRRPGLQGYYLMYPALGDPKKSIVNDGAADKAWLEMVAAMSVAQKNEVTFAAAEFALRQKRALARLDHPEWLDEQIDEEARRLVFGGWRDG